MDKDAKSEIMIFGMMPTTANPLKIESKTVSSSRLMRNNATLPNTVARSLVVVGCVVA